MGHCLGLCRIPAIHDMATELTPGMQQYNEVRHTGHAARLRAPVDALVGLHGDLKDQELILALGEFDAHALGQIQL